MPLSLIGKKQKKPCPIICLFMIQHRLMGKCWDVFSFLFVYKANKYFWTVNIILIEVSSVEVLPGSLVWSTNREPHFSFLAQFGFTPTTSIPNQLYSLVSAYYFDVEAIAHNSSILWWVELKSLVLDDKAPHGATVQPIEVIRSCSLACYMR